MHKQLCMMAASTLLSIPFLYETTNQVEYSITIDSKNVVVENLQLFVLDENDKNVGEIILNEYGEGNITLPEGKYYVDHGNLVEGILPFREPLELEKELHVSLQPIQQMITTSVAQEVVIEDIETKKIKKIKVEKEMDIGNYLLYNHTYKIYQKEGIEGKMQKEPILFQVGYKNDPISFLYEKAYAVSLEEETESSIVFFYDVDGKKEVLNYDGEPLELKKQESIHLEKGKYYYQYKNIPENYYLMKEMYELNVEEDMVVSIPLQKVEQVFQIDSFAHYTFFVKDEEEIVAQWVNDGTERSVNLKRNKTYTLSSNEIEGYYSIEPITFTTTEEYSTSQPILIKDVPIGVFVEMKETLSDKKISNVEFCVENVTRGYTEILSSIDGMIEVKGIYPRDELHISIVNTPDGYRMNEKVEIVNIQDKQVFIVSFELEPYVLLNIPFPTNTPNMQYGLYEDVSCKQVVKDIEENEVLFHSLCQTAKLTNGTYYLKQVQSEKNYYTDRQVYEIKVNSKETKKLEYSLLLKKCLVDLGIKDLDTQEWIQGIKLRLKKENGEIVEEWESSKDKEFQLEKGTVYIFEQFDKAKGYIESAPIRFRLEDKENDVLTYALKTQRYYNLSLLNDQDIQYGLYQDENREKIVKDIYGNEVIFGNEQDNYSLKSGIYYLRQLENSRQYFYDDSYQKVELDQDKQITVHALKASVKFIIQDDKKHIVKETMWEIEDKEGKKIAQIGENGIASLEYPFVQCGQTYTIRNVSMPDTYQKTEDIVFEIPFEASDSPEVIITLKEKEIKENVEENLNESPSKLFVIIGISLGSVIGLWTGVSRIRNRFSS